MAAAATAGAGGTRAPGDSAPGTPRTTCCGTSCYESPSSFGLAAVPGAEVAVVAPAAAPPGSSSPLAITGDARAPLFLDLWVRVRELVNYCLMLSG